MAMIFGCYALQKASEFSKKKPGFFITGQNFLRGFFLKKKKRRQTLFHVSHLSFPSETGNLVLAHIYYLSCQFSYSSAAGGCTKAWEGDKIVSDSAEYLLTQLISGGTFRKSRVGLDFALCSG